MGLLFQQQSLFFLIRRSSQIDGFCSWLAAVLLLVCSPLFFSITDSGTTTPWNLHSPPEFWVSPSWLQPGLWLSSIVIWPPGGWSGWPIILPPVQSFSWTPLPSPCWVFAFSTLLSFDADSRVVNKRNLQRKLELGDLLFLLCIPTDKDMWYHNLSG